MRLAEIQGHIASMGELLDIVGAMRSLASMRMQEAQRALPGIRRYADAMANAIGAALLLMPEARPETRGAWAPGDHSLYRGARFCRRLQREPRPAAEADLGAAGSVVRSWQPGRGTGA